VPYWMIAAVLAIPPVASVLRKTGFWHRSPPGHCPACGYDLRASRGRCPECGRPIANDATEPAAPFVETAA
jgi:predicted amidophosphoribosyltransferase